jgi:DNA-binding beta-propeller fold protein YncE
VENRTMTSETRSRVSFSIGALLAVTLAASCSQGTGSPSNEAPSGTNAAAATPAATPKPSPTAPAPQTTTIDGIPATTLYLGRDDAPIDVTFAFGSIWIADHHADTVTRLDPESMTVQARIPVATGPGWFVVTDDALWVSSQLGRGMDRIDPSTNTADVHAGDWATCGRGILAFGAIWQPACDAHQIMRIDPVARTSRDLSAGAHNAVVLAGHDLLATSPAGLARLDPETGTFEEMGGPAGWLMAFDGKTVWIIDDLQVTRVRPADGSTVATLPIRSGPVVFRDGHAWLLSQDNALLDVDLATSKTLQTINFGFSPTSIVDAAGALWITSFDGSSVIRLEV